MENTQSEHILVGLSSAPSNARIIRTAATMASAFHCRFTALFIRTPDYSAMAPADRKRLQENTALAESLGAGIETIFGDDVSYQLAEYARLSGVTKIVVGRSSATRRRFFGKPTLTEKLTAIAPNIDIHIIPDASADSAYYPRKVRRRLNPRVFFTDCCISLGILVPTTALGFLFKHVGFSEANIITLYLLAVLISAVFTKGYISNILTAVLGVLSFNFFFTEPRFSLQAYAAGYPVTFLIMLLAGLITTSLATRWKGHVKQSTRAAYRTSLIFETNQLLQKARSDREIFTVASTQLEKLLDQRFAIVSVSTDLAIHRNGFQPDSTLIQSVIKTHRQQDTCYPIKVSHRLYGVVALEGGGLEAFESSVLQSILGECALALESSKNAREKEEARLLAEREKLRANLLRSISHDLRTPLTSISGNACILLEEDEQLDRSTRKHMFADIYDDSQWLINLVENLLAITRIEGGHMAIKKEPQLAEELVEEALAHISRKKSEHIITVQHHQDLLFALCDARLLVQVLINLIDNAIKHTPAGSRITVSTDQQGEFARFSVADNGSGISNKAEIFDMFYTGSSDIADCRRSLGLGLSLCKSIVNAHGGDISVTDNVPQGAVFTFTIPTGEVTFRE